MVMQNRRMWWERKIEDIKLPKGATIGAIVRGLPQAEGMLGNNLIAEQERVLRRSGNDIQVIIAHHDTVIEREDHVILFVINRKMIREVEKLCQVNVGFL